jgi:hypothetical protein
MVSSGLLERSEGACACLSWLGVAGAWAWRALALDESRECPLEGASSSLGGMAVKLRRQAVKLRELQGKAALERGLSAARGQDKRKAGVLLLLMPHPSRLDIAASGACGFKHRRVFEDPRSLADGRRASLSRTTAAMVHPPPAVAVSRQCTCANLGPAGDGRCHSRDLRIQERQDWPVRKHASTEPSALV